MPPLRSIPARAAMPDGPGSAGRRARRTRQGSKAEKVRAEHRRKRLLPSGLPCLEHFSAVARASRTARRIGVAVLRDPTADSLQAHVLDGNAENRKCWAGVARRRSITIASETGGRSMPWLS
jgi:hypothetical protein